MCEQAITGQRHQLANKIVVSPQVLNELWDKNIINTEQKLEIEAEKTPYKKAEALLSALQPHDDETVLKAVCEIFNNDLQEEVSKMLAKNEAQKSPAVDKFQSDPIVKLIEPNDEFLYHLRDRRVIDENDFEIISGVQNPDGKIRVLYSYLNDKWNTAEVVDALQKSGQRHVSNYINNKGVYGEEYGDNWPLGEMQLRILSHPALTVGLELTSDFLDKLVTAGCISEHQKNTLGATELIELLKRRSVANYKKFFRCLENTQPAEVICIFDWRKALALIRSTVLCQSGEESWAVEKTVIEVFKSSYAKEQNDDKSALVVVNNYLDDVQWRSLVSYVERTDGIGWYLDCTDYNALEQIKLKMELLKQCLEKAVARFCGRKVSLVVNWRTDEYNRCHQYLSSFLDEVVARTSIPRSYSAPVQLSRSASRDRKRTRRVLHKVRSSAPRRHQKEVKRHVTSDSNENCDGMASGYNARCDQHSELRISGANNRTDSVCTEQRQGTSHLRSVSFYIDSNETADAGQHSDNLETVIIDPHCGLLDRHVDQEAVHQEDIGFICHDSWYDLHGEVLTDQHSESLVKEGYQLVKGELLKILEVIIDLQNDLLQSLLDKKVLDGREIELVNSESSNSSKVGKLLSHIGLLSHEQQELFLLALDKTHQSHITNFIRCNGLRPTTETDNWPLYGSSQWTRIVQTWDRLIENIDSHSVLLAALVEKQCINCQQMWCIGRNTTDADRNQSLLMTIKRKSLGAYKVFIDCLIVTRQHLVVALLEPGCSTEDPPVNERQISILEANYTALIALINVKESDLLNELLLADVLTEQLTEYIESAATRLESKKRLLNVVKRGSQSNFDKFIDCLVRTEQHVVAELLLSAAVVAVMMAYDRWAYDRWSYDDENDGIVLFTHAIYKVRPAQLIAVQMTGHRVKLFMICESLSELMHTYELYANYRLEALFTDFITTLPDIHAVRAKTAYRLEWEWSDYMRCLIYLSSSINLPIYSQIHRLSLTMHMEHTVRSLTLDGFPHELIELVLLKAAGQLFSVLKKILSHADVYTVVTLLSVQRYWWETLSDRLSNRRRLRRVFSFVCAPYRLNGKLWGTLHAAGLSCVAGVAELNDKLYVVSYGSDTIQVKSIYLPNSRLCELDLKDIVMKDLLCCPADIAACCDMNCLFISDVDSRCIWRITLSSYKSDEDLYESIDEFISTKYFPSTLSVRLCRLMVTNSRGTAVYIYSCFDGYLLTRIELPFTLSVRHAVMSRYETVIACLTNRALSVVDPEHENVSEITFACKHLRECNCASGFSMPFYLTMDSQQNIFVCDRYKKTIVHLSGDLSLQRVVLQLREQPCRLHYSERRGLLFVCYIASSVIDVFKLV